LLPLTLWPWLRFNFRFWFWFGACSWDCFFALSWSVVDLQLLGSEAMLMFCFVGSLACVWSLVLCSSWLMRCNHALYMLLLRRTSIAFLVVEAMIFSLFT
jgi:hypothetical protein